MPLQFILGSSGAGKSHTIYQKIIDESRQFSNRNYIVLVPEQFTMQTQKQLVEMHPAHAIMNIDVLSFARLAYRIFDEVGTKSVPVLEETGKSFVLQKIAQEKKKELKVCGNNMKKPGYISEMKSMISELMQYRIAPVDMDKMIATAEAKPMLKYKLEDVQVIFAGFADYLKGRNITPEEVLEVASIAIPQSEILKNSTIIMDGFTGFTPVQYRLIQALLKSCPKIYVTATIDNREDPFRKDSYHQLFHMSREMIGKLIRLTEEVGTSCDEPIKVSNPNKDRFAKSPALRFLEQNLFRQRPATYEAQQNEISITAAENPAAEAAVVVSQIRRLIKEEGLRYKDIAIITGDLEKYRELLTPFLQSESIPFFADETHSVLMNPFVEFLRSAIDMTVSSLSYESVFRYLRSGMSNVTIADIDMLENYVIALGIRGKAKWSETWVRTYRGMNKAKLLYVNEIREQFLAEISDFLEDFCGRDKTTKERTESLYQFIVKNNIQDKLGEREQYFQTIGEDTLVKEYAQIYGIIMNLLDKLVEVLGTEKISMADYQQLLEAGFGEARVGIIPPSADQLVIGDVKRTRLADIKALFFMGVNEGVIPQKSSKGAVLSEMEREFLKDADVELSPGVREDIYIQRFYLYQNITKPSRHLCLSYAQATSSGEGNVPAYLISLLTKMFTQLEIKEKNLRQPAIDDIDSVARGLDALPNILRSIVAGNQNEEDMQLLRWFLGNDKYRETTKKLLVAAFYESQTDGISAGVARALYGDVIENSATRLEKFSACAFAHFLQYGLCLSKRVEYEFNSMDMGTVMHGALERFTLKLNKENLDLRNVPDEKRDETMCSCVDEVMMDYGNDYINSNARNKYLVARVKRIMQRTAWALQEQARKGDFVPGGVEVSFAMEDGLTSTNIALTNDSMMRLKGRIDRVDVCEDDDKVYVKIIDYKSGNKSLDLIELYHGLQLQLVVYLNAALEIEQKKHVDKPVEPAGIFYYNIGDPLVTVNADDDDAGIKNKILEELRMNGLASTYAKAIEHLDHTLDQGSNNKSKVCAVSLTKDGNYVATSKVINKEQFTAMAEYVSDKVVEIGQQIMAGKVDINPYELKSKNACTYCEYYSICSFDERLNGCHYRQLSSMSEKELWQKISKEER